MSKKLKPATRMQQEIGDKPVEFPYECLGSYGTPDQTGYAWAAVEVKEDKVVVKHISTPTTCRESHCSYMHKPRHRSPGMRKNQVTVGVRAHSSRNYDIDHYESVDTSPHMGKGKPTVALLFSHDFEKMKKGLHVVHHFEKIARCGELTKIFKVQHKIHRRRRNYKEGTVENVPYSKELILVVAPEFWGQAIPLASLHLLILRLISHRVPTKKQDVHAYMKSCMTGRTARSDHRHMKTLYGENGYAVDALVRHWRALVKTVNKWEQHQGSYGATRLTQAAHSILEAKKNKSTEPVRAKSRYVRKRVTPESRARRDAGIHWQFALKLAQYLEKKRAELESNNKTGSA